MNSQYHFDSLERWRGFASCDGTWCQMISSWWLKVVNNPLGWWSFLSWYLASPRFGEEVRKKSQDFQMKSVGEDKIMRQCMRWFVNMWRERNQERYLIHTLCSVHHQSCGAFGVTAMIKVCDNWFLDDGCLLALLPVSCQQHGGMWTEVLGNGENENYEDEMIIENDLSVTCFLLAFLWFLHGLDDSNRVLWLRYFLIYVLNSFLKLRSSVFYFCHHVIGLIVCIPMYVNED